MWSGAIISLMDAASRHGSLAPWFTLDELEYMDVSMSPGNPHISSALPHTRLVSVDFARLMIHHHDRDELPVGMMGITESLSYRLSRFLLYIFERCPGIDVRQQGECTSIRLACYPS